MFACLYIFDFLAQAALRPDPSYLVLRRSPVAILDGPDSLQCVVASNQPARLAGIDLGMTKAQVELLSEVVLRQRFAAGENAAQTALLDCALAFSPRVESTAAGTVIADLLGTEKLFGSPQNIARLMSLRAEEFGFETNVAVAANPDTSRIAAIGLKGISVIAAGEEEKRLARLPVEVLSAAPAILDTLDSWGIRSLGALAKLPPLSIVERLGQEGLQFQRQARGEARRTLVPVNPADNFEEVYEFETPVETVESLAFIVSRLLHQLCLRVSTRSLALTQLRLGLELEVRQLRNDSPQEAYERIWKLPQPMVDAKVLLRLVRLDLEAKSFSAPVRRISLQALPARQRSAQAGLFTPAAPQAEQLEITVARIRGIVGAADENGIDCVGSPQVLDSHKPDNFLVQPFSAETPDNPNRAVLSVSLRMFRPALTTSVELRDGKPFSLLLNNRRAQILCASGPWSASGNWWEPSALWAREEWDVALKTSDGSGLYRIVRDRIRQQWFIAGLFD
jgi:protein ImuB